MRRIAYMITICVLFLAACSGENDRVSGADAKKTIDRVHQQLDDAATKTEDRLDDAMDRIDEASK